MSVSVAKIKIHCMDLQGKTDLQVLKICIETLPKTAKVSELKELYSYYKKHKN
jgi:hypothetical protein